MADGCRYTQAWVGLCGKDVYDDGLCAEHFGQECSAHPEMQATSECSHTGQFVCGVRCCDLHPNLCLPHGGKVPVLLPDEYAALYEHAKRKGDTPVPTGVLQIEGLLTPESLEAVGEWWLMHDLEAKTGHSYHVNTPHGIVKVTYRRLDEQAAA